MNKNGIVAVVVVITAVVLVGLWVMRSGQTRPGGRQFDCAAPPSGANRSRVHEERRRDHRRLDRAGRRRCADHVCHRGGQPFGPERPGHLRGARDADQLRAADAGRAPSSCASSPATRAAPARRRTKSRSRFLNCSPDTVRHPTCGGGLSSASSIVVAALAAGFVEMPGAGRSRVRRVVLSALQATLTPLSNRTSLPLFDIIWSVSSSLAIVMLWLAVRRAWRARSLRALGCHAGDHRDGGGRPVPVVRVGVGLQLPAPGRGGRLAAFQRRARDAGALSCARGARGAPVE